MKQSTFVMLGVLLNGRCSKITPFTIFYSIFENYKEKNEQSILIVNVVRQFISKHV